MLDYSPSAVTSYALGVLSPEPYDAFTQAAFDAGRRLTAAQRGGLHDGSPGDSAFSGPLDAVPALIMAFNEWANGRSAFAQAASRDSLSATLRGGVELFRPGYQGEAVGVSVKYSFSKLTKWRSNEGGFL